MKMRIEPDCGILASHDELEPEFMEDRNGRDSGFYVRPLCAKVAVWLMAAAFLDSYSALAAAASDFSWSASSGGEMNSGTSAVMCFRMATPSRRQSRC